MATKKPIKRAAVAAKTAPAATAMPACNMGGGCGCGYRCGFMKKLIVMVMVFAAGFATCHYMCVKKGFHGFQNGMRMQSEMFVDGCLDTTKMKNEKMADKIATADKDGNGCITKEEMDMHREEMRGKPMMRQ